MSKYTTTLRFICESKNNLDESSALINSDKIIDNALDSIFKFEYPIFDESYRKILEKKIIKHYYFREIGFETFALFQFFLAERLNLIMPKYNKLYNSALQDFDILSNNATVKTSTTKNNENSVNDYNKNICESVSQNQNTRTNNIVNNNLINTSKQISNNNSTEKNGSTDYKLSSDTPQGGLQGVDSMQYLSNATKNTNESNNLKTDNLNSTVENNNKGSVTTNDESSLNSTTNTNSNNNAITNNKVNSTTDYIEKISSYNNITAAELISQYVDLFKTTDELIINELSDLFMNIY